MGGVRPGKGNVGLSRRSDKSQGRFRWALVDGCLKHGYRMRVGGTPQTKRQFIFRRQSVGAVSIYSVAGL